MDHFIDEKLAILHVLSAKLRRNGSCVGEPPFNRVKVTQNHLFSLLMTRSQYSTARCYWVEFGANKWKLGQQLRKFPEDGEREEEALLFNIR